MPRKATGSAVWRPHVGCWEAVVTNLDRSRKWIKMRKFTDPNDREGAKAQAAIVSKRWREGGYVDDSSAETLAEYFDRWAKARTKRGLASVRDDRGRFEKWVAEPLGTFEMGAVSPDDLKRFVATLDEHVRAHRLAWKTAKHVWQMLGKLFDDACNSKDVALVVRRDDPADSVRGPDQGVEREGPYLFPSEFQTLMRCAVVPASRRMLYALAVYSGMRKGELRVFEWPDVHDDEGYLGAHRAADRDTGELKPTKGKRARKVPIEPELAPLLEVMRDYKRSSFVLPTRTVASNALPIFLREDLKRAGITRRELFEDTETTRKLDFHDLRHTYGTWRAIRGDAIQHVRAAMGHTTMKTTERYINEAQIFDRARFGIPFGPLPIETLRETLQATIRGANFPGKPVGRAGLETVVALGQRTREASQNKGRPLGSPSETEILCNVSPARETLAARLRSARLARDWDAVAEVERELVQQEERTA